jgi:hypothetical protein
MALANMLSILQRVSWSMDVVPSILIATAAGSSALKVGGMAKAAGTWACATVLTDNSVVVGGSVRIHGNPVIYMGYHSSGPGILPAVYLSHVLRVSC